MKKAACTPFTRKPGTRFLTSVLTVLAAFTLMSASASAQVSVTATAGTIGPTPYATLGAAFAAINAGTHQGDITIDITADTAEGATPATLNSSGAGSATYTSVLMRPTADGVTISGSPATGFGVVQLNGADNVTIDGDNPNTAGVNRNLTIANAAASAVTFNSVVRIATSAAVTSADNNTIKNCVLNGNVTAGNAAAITTTASSSNSSFGFYAGGNGGATATSAPTALISVTANTAPTGTTINGLLVDNNAVNQTARAIVFLGAATSVSSGVTITNNTVGTGGAPSPAVPPYTSPATTVYTKGVFVGGTSAATITGNTLQNIMSYVGIAITTVELVSPIGASVTINNNIVTNPTNNGTAAFAAKGILVSNATGALTIRGNTVSGVQAMGGASGTAGIDASGAATSGTIELNRIATVYNRSAGTFGAWGLNIGAGANLTLRNNFVSDVRMDMTGGFAFSTTFGLHGIRIAGGTAHKVYHNSVNLFGPLLGAATTSILSSAFTIVSTAQTGLDVRNNVFANTTTGGTTSIAHVSIYLPPGGTSAMNLTLNNNGYYSGTDSARQGLAQVGTVAGTNFFLASNFNPNYTTPATNFRSYSSALSVGGANDNASFATTVAAPFTSTTDLHIPAATATQLESAGVGTAVTGVTTDIDGETRPGPPGSVNGGGFAPDLGADEFDGVPVDLTAPAISYAPFGNTTQTTNRSLNATITDATGVSGGADAPRIYYRKNGGSYVSTQCGAPAGSVYPCTIDYALVGFVALGDVIDYFVVAQDAAANVGANPSGGFSATSVNNITTPPSPPNTYGIVTPFPATVDVGTAQATTSLTGAGGLFAQINAGVLTGNVTVNVTSDLTEDGTNALNQWSEEGAGGYTLTIQSSGAALRTISGAVANGMIRLNGADRVTFDGRVGGLGQFLLFRNTNTTNPTFSFLNDATNNLIESCLIEGGNTSAASGTVVFGTSAGTLGNSGNTIHGCDIRDRSDAPGVPANAVFSSGSAGAPNGGNTVSACNVFNWTNAGLLVSAAGAGSGWAVNQSSFFQTAARTTVMTGISIQGGANGHSIVNNSVGGMAPGAGGSFLATSMTFRGIDLTVGIASPTSVQGNVVKNIRSTLTGAFTASYGIYLEAGRADIGTVSGNTVGSSNAAERYEINGDSYGIRVTSTSSVNLSNNTVNNFGTNATPPTGEFYFGILVEGTGGAHTVVNNTVTNVTNNSVPDASFNTLTTGMTVSATGVGTVRRNTISNVASTNPTLVTANNNRVWGLIISAAAVGTVVERNNISNLTGASPTTGARADVITGLQSQTLANATYSNNMVSLSGGGASSDRAIFAMLDLSASPAVSNYYFNSVDVFGVATGANNTYAFNRNNTATVTLRDNVFANVRAIGTGFNVAMANTNASATGWSATASNFNRLHNLTNAHLTQWLGSGAGNNLDLAGFQAATGGDANSSTGDPLFVSDTDLHLQPASPVVAAGTPAGGVTNDFDNDPRSGTAPDIGADEVLPLPVDLSVTKTHAGAPAPGQSVVYTITVSNAGPRLAAGTAIVDNFPAVLTCSFTATQTGGATGFTASGSGNINDPAVSMPAGSVVTYTATCGIPANATGPLSNTATVTGSGVNDLNPANNLATDAYVLAPTGDLSIGKDDGVTNVFPGGTVTYTIAASNPGPSDASGSTATDNFPAECSSVNWTCVGAGGGTCPASGSGNIANTVNLPPGGSVTYTATCNVSGSASGSLVNTATIAGPGGFTDPVPGNNSATDTDVIGLAADLSMTKSDGQISAIPGQTATYTIVASSAGPSNAPGSSVTDTFPAACTSVNWTCIGAGGGVCTASGSGNINDTVNLPSGASVTYTAACSVSPAATGTLSNTATVATPAGVTDPIPGNNSATDSDTLAPTGDLSITKDDGVTNVVAGGSTTYTIVATNPGPSDAPGGSVTDTFPAACTTVNWTCVGSGGGVCQASGSGNIADTVNLPRASTVTYSATCNISTSATGSLVNTATVAGPGGFTDPVSGNNSATDTDVIGALADLSVALSDAVDPLIPGATLALTATLGNAGPSTSTGMTLVVNLPAGVTFVSSIPPSPTCVHSSGIVTCNLPGLAVSGSQVVNVNATVNTGILGLLTTTATVTGIETDPVTGNNSDSETTTVNGLKGDFDVDGKTDILFRHAVSGKNVVWFMNGITRTAGVFTNPDVLPDTNWQMVGTSDFNSDNKTDIVFRHAVSGKNVVWYMDGITRTAGVFTNPDQLPDTNWRIVGTGDFSTPLDAKPDLLFRHAVSGKNVVWYMNGITRTAGVFTNPDVLADTNWQMVGIGDFSSPQDGKADILWRHGISGKNVVWYMDGITRTGGVFTNPDVLPDTNWMMSAVGDYSLPPDGKPDILFRHAISGKNVVWYMDGITRTGGVFTNPSVLPDTHWRIVGPK